MFGKALAPRSTRKNLENIRERRICKVSRVQGKQLYSHIFSKANKCDLHKCARSTYICCVYATFYEKIKSHHALVSTRKNHKLYREAVENNEKMKTKLKEVVSRRNTYHDATYVQVDVSLFMLDYSGTRNG